MDIDVEAEPMAADDSDAGEIETTPRKSAHVSQSRSNTVLPASPSSDPPKQRRRAAVVVESEDDEEQSADQEGGDIPAGLWVGKDAVGLPFL